MLQVVFDAIGTNAKKLNPNAGVIMAGYVTGTGDVPWNDALWTKYPDAIRIDQSPVNTAADETADVYDLESGAGRLDRVTEWFKKAHSNYLSAVRPGQRYPCIYSSMTNVTPLVNQLVKDGITHSPGPALWVADWSATTDKAVAMLVASAGPYPIVGFQYAKLQLFDESLFLNSWIHNKSVKPAPPLPKVDGVVVYSHAGTLISEHVTAPQDNLKSWSA